MCGGLSSYYRKYLPNLAKHMRPIMSLLKKNAVVFKWTDAMTDVVRGLTTQLSSPPVLAFPDWDAALDGSRKFHLYCDASKDGLGATLEQEQLDGSIRPIVFLSRATLPNERNWPPLELEAGAVVWSIKRLRQFLFNVPFSIWTDHRSLENLASVGEHNPRIMRWLEFLSAYDYTLKYRKGSDNGNADFLSRLPQPVTEQDVSDTCRLTDPTDVGIYFVGACGVWPRGISAAEPGSVLLGPPGKSGVSTALAPEDFSSDFRSGEGARVVAWEHPPQVDADIMPRSSVPVYALDCGNSRRMGSILGGLGTTESSILGGLPVFEDYSADFLLGDGTSLKGPETCVFPVGLISTRRVGVKMR